jgi:hypothetical protein
MAPWNASRRLWSTGKSVQPHRQMEAATCSLPVRGSCSSTTQARSASSPNPKPIVQLPVERPTSCAFGGPDRDTMFVTSARTDLDDDALGRQPLAGRVFAIDGLGVRGLPCLPYRGRTPQSSGRERYTRNGAA